MTQIFGALTLAMVGVIIADILIHPSGTQAAGTQLNNTLSTTFGAMLGQ